LNPSNTDFWTKSRRPSEFAIQSHKFEADKHGIVLAVSDGCGGEMASEMAVETVKRMLYGEIPDLDDSFYNGVDNITVILAKLFGSELKEPTEDSVVIYPLIFPEDPNDIKN